MLALAVGVALLRTLARRRGVCQADPCAYQHPGDTTVYRRRVYTERDGYPLLHFYSHGDASAD